MIAEAREAGLLEQPADAANRCLQDPDLFFMSEDNYERTWTRVTGVPYNEFGRPVSLNMRWRKAPGVDGEEVSP